eukprot:GHVS01107827.1.p1 GENE.GHVS01107827.1~~GHVS01107827.1.p1  ORF type:complete len:162 (+),score=34.19 GHVS01107827.1:476-961(+)
MINSSGCQEFHLLTAQGANSQSYFYYSQVKGKLEDYICSKINFSKLFIYRPALLLCDRQESRPAERLVRGLANLFDFGNKFSITTDDLAAVMVDTAIQQHQQQPHQQQQNNGIKDGAQEKKEEVEDAPNKSVEGAKQQIIFEHADIVNKAKQLIAEKYSTS